MSSWMKVVDASQFSVESIDRSIDANTMSTVEAIVDDVRVNGALAVRKLATQFHERTADQPLWIERDVLKAAAESIDQADLELLQRVASRIRAFAKSQLDCLSSLTVEVPGGLAGHTIEPIERVGCYAPGGRFPLPSTVLMTAVTAKVAGCSNIIVASPNPNEIVLAAAYVAGANRVLAVGGAHAIAAMAYGIGDEPACDLVCGPGSRWVTAAKKAVVGDCGIDMLAGPSELVIVADDEANAETVAADLLAQAEHDVDARPILISLSRSFADSVCEAIDVQLGELDTALVARESLGKSAIVVCDNLNEAVAIANQIGPEHLELHLQEAEKVARKIRHAGCIFIGSQSAEVFGDYGVGPNHTLPTAGSARWTGGLNVLTFLRVRTWLSLKTNPSELIEDTARLAELEGLNGHRKAALRRR